MLQGLRGLVCLLLPLAASLAMPMPASALVQTYCGINLINDANDDDGVTDSGQSAVDCSLGDATSRASATGTALDVDAAQPHGAWSNYALAGGAYGEDHTLIGNSSGDIVPVTLHLAVAVRMQQEYFPELFDGGVIADGHTSFNLILHALNTGVGSHEGGSYYANMHGSWHTRFGATLDFVTAIDLGPFGTGTAPASIIGGDGFSFVRLIEIPLNIRTGFRLSVSGNGDAWSMEEVVSETTIDVALLGVTGAEGYAAGMSLLGESGDAQAILDPSGVAFVNPYAAADIPVPGLAGLLAAGVMALRRPASRSKR